MDIGFDDFKAGLTALKEGIDIVKLLRNLMPNSPEKEAALKSIEEAENKAILAEASFAKSLGFVLCPKCWPPSILRATFVGGNQDNYKCQSCGTCYANKGKGRGVINLREYVPEETSQPDIRE